MLKKLENEKQFEVISEIIVTFAIVMGAFISYHNHTIAAILIMLGALSGYIMMWYSTKNLFDFLGLMYLGFVLPLGMANLRWANYQGDWEGETWLCFTLAVICYMIGYSFRTKFVDGILKSKFVLKMKDNQTNYSGLFVFGIVVFLCLLSGFFIKWWVAGSLPLFNWQGAQTYVQYLSGEQYWEAFQETMKNTPFLYTLVKGYHRFSTIFMFQGWLASCAVYAYCVKCTAKMWEKIVSGIIIVVSTIIPYVIVVREIFMMQTIAFAVFAFIISKRTVKKYAIVILMAVITIVGFVGMSRARGYTQNQIAEVFEMNEVKIDEQVDESVDEPSDKPSDKPLDEPSDEPADEPAEVVTTKYPATVIWVYTYFTSGFDNFNHLTKTLDYHTYGLMQLRPIFSALQIDDLMDIDMKLQNDKYRVSPNVTIYTFLCDPYVDFGMVGVILSMILWGAVFGVISEICMRFKGAVSVILYGGIGHHIIFMAFVSWMGHFSYLCSFGLLFIYFIIWLIRERRCGK